MSEVLETIEKRIADIRWKISQNDNIKNHIEELDFLKELLGKLMMSEDFVDESKIMDTGVLSDILGTFKRGTPIFVYNSVPGDDEKYRFSILSSYQFNKEKKTIELFYHEDDEYSYEDY
jgi:hypothetical protein